MPTIVKDFREIAEIFRELNSASIGLADLGASWGFR